MLNTGNILQQGKLVCAQRMPANLCYQVKDVVQCYAANSFVIAITLIDIFVASTKINACVDNILHRLATLRTLPWLTLYIYDSWTF